MWKVRELADKVTNVVMNYTEIEAKVREATNDDPWGPTGTLKHELAQATFSYDQFPEVMGMLWKRIAENKRNPRRIYKSLLLLHHLLLNGSDRVIRASTDRIYEIRQLQDYHVVYEPGFNLASIMPIEEYKDGETNVRVKAKEIVELIQDEERLREDRKKAKKNRDKYVGMGSEGSMGSKWSDFDDDLHFPKKQSNSFKYFDENEQGEEVTESSPARKSNSSNSPKAFNIKLKSKNDLENDIDFNPRANEDNSSTYSTTKSSNSTKKHNSNDGDFVDFQSAFGEENSGAKIIQGQNTDLFSSSSVLQAPNTLPIQNNSVDLFGLDLISNSSNPQQSNTSSNTTFDTFQTVQSFPTPITTGINQNQASLIQNNIQNSIVFPQAQTVNLFDDFSAPVLPCSGGETTLLQPQQINSNNINNNHIGSTGNKTVNPSNNKSGFEGTTWSDLNLSLDDLTLSSKPKQQMPQPTMNQLISSPTRSTMQPF